jgi:hypothetical protein
MQNVKKIYIQNDKDFRQWLTKDRPELSSERAPESDRIVAVKH